MARGIVWASTKAQFQEGRQSLYGSEVINVDLRFFDAERAEAAKIVMIYRDHPKAETCAAHYRKTGAEVHLFGPEPKAEESPAPRRAVAKQ